MKSVSDVVKEFDSKPFERRTIKSLSKNLNVEDAEIKSIFSANPDVFKKVSGCKGEMYVYIEKEDDAIGDVIDNVKDFTKDKILDKKHTNYDDDGNNEDDEEEDTWNDDDQTVWRDQNDDMNDDDQNDDNDDEEEETNIPDTKIKFH